MFLCFFSRKMRNFAQNTEKMSRKHKERQIIEAVEITDVAAEGKSLARINDKVVFVPYAVPGDIVDIEIVRKKHSYMEGVVAKTVKESPLRVAPLCPHFGVCGGCKWQMLPYSEQIRWKQKQVMEDYI